ncbi:MAG: hypothetical protein ACRDP6_01235 [Actinoallomurus sp.]
MPTAGGEASPAGTEEGRDGQIAALTELVGTLARNLRRMEGRLAKLAKDTAGQNDQDDPAAPGAWVWFHPPAVTEDQPEGAQDPHVTIENFVTWFNVTFAGVDGGRAKAIPACWTQHPGLALEVAALAYSWRDANIGPTAASRDAQYWLHQWRPGIADRLRDWVHADCLDGDHQLAGAPPRHNRFGGLPS